MPPGLVDHPVLMEEFGIQDRRSCRAANGVVSEHHKLDVEDRAAAHATDDRRHPMLDIAIEDRLRPVGLHPHDNRMLRRRRQIEPLWLATVGVEDLNDLLRFGGDAATSD